MNKIRQYTLFYAFTGIVCLTGGEIGLAQQFRAPTKPSEATRNEPVPRLRLTQQSENPIRRDDNPRALPDSGTVPPPPGGAELRQPSSIDNQQSDSLDPFPAPRDPTKVRPELQQLLDPAAEQTTQQGPISVQLRGRISMGNQPTVAILQVGEMLYLVQEGTRVNAGNPPKAMIVKKLTATTAEIELEYLNNRVIDLQ